MNTTLKDFIINNLTDEHFERLVYHLIIEDICCYNLNLYERCTAYYQEKRYITEKNTFTILHAIQKFQKEDLNSPYQYIKKMPIPYLKGELALDFDLEAHEVTENDYQLYINQELFNKTVDFIRFIYKVLESKPKDPLAATSRLYNEWLKLNNNTDIPTRSFLEITDKPQYMDGYCIRILLDNRTRYVSAEAESSYRLKFETNIEITPIKFAEYVEIWEDLGMSHEYRLEPFTQYLNEPFSVPPVSDEVIYDLLEQLIIVLTAQGFTEQEQLETIRYFDQHFDKKYY